MPSDDDLRCSGYSRNHDVSPIGTAGCYRGFLLIEWPMPWPRDAADVEELAEVVAVARSEGFRLQLVSPPEPVRGNSRMVISYRWDEVLGRYTGAECEADAGAVPEVAARIVRGEGADAGSAVQACDVLICTHGRRDRCCGSIGTALAMELAAGPEILSASGMPVRLWRTSHTGGHRFAATGLVFPEGTCWGYLDEAVLRRVVARQGAFGEVAGCYRGCAGLSSPEAQALEGAVLGEAGWSVLNAPRSVETDGEDPERLRLVVGAGGGAVYEGRVRIGRVLPIPDCGRPVGESHKTEKELAVEAFARA